MNANSMDRMLLLSSKPYLHMNVDCNAIVAAIVSRQTFVVEMLLRVSVLTITQPRLLSSKPFVLFPIILLSSFYANKNILLYRRVSRRT